MNRIVIEPDNRIAEPIENSIFTWVFKNPYRFDYESTLYRNRRKISWSKKRGLFHEISYGRSGGLVFDSNDPTIGVVFADPEKLRDSYKVSRLSPQFIERAKVYLQYDFEEENAYITGDSYKVLDIDSKDDNGDAVELYSGTMSECSEFVHDATRTGKYRYCEDRPEGAFDVL